MVDADFEVLRDITERANVFDGAPVMPTVEALRSEIDGDHVVLATDVRVASVGEAAVGYVYTFYLPSDATLERCYVFGCVDPEHRGQGVGRALIAWGIERASAQLRSSGSALPKVIRVDARAQVETAHRLFDRMGFTSVRWFEELLRPLTDLPERRTVPGIDIVVWPDDRDEEIRIVKNIAFADHWGSTPTSTHHWAEMVRGYGARPDLSVVALDADGAVVAHCMCSRYPEDDALLGRSDGWVSYLGTLPQWRGKGLASALIIESLHRFAADGLTHASIGVDADSPTGAARLYRSLGFEPNQQSVTHEIVLSNSEAGFDRHDNNVIIDP
jgi:ribosomal protein S18 acetylase RimI-like enzyme